MQFGDILKTFVLNHFRENLLKKNLLKKECYYCDERYNKIAFIDLCSATFHVMMIAGSFPGLEICWSLQVYLKIGSSDCQLVGKIHESFEQNGWGSSMRQPYIEGSMTSLIN